MKNIHTNSYYSIPVCGFSNFFISNDVFDPEQLPLLYKALYDFSQKSNRANLELIKPSAYKIFFVEHGCVYEGFISGRDLENVVCDMSLLSEKKEERNNPERPYGDITVYETLMHELKTFKIQHDYWDVGTERRANVMLVTKNNEIHEAALDIHRLAEHFVYPTKHNR